jgi:hypothetical protein
MCSTTCEPLLVQLPRNLILNLASNPSCHASNFGSVTSSSGVHEQREAVATPLRSGWMNLIQQRRFEMDKGGSEVEQASVRVLGEGLAIVTVVATAAHGPHLAISMRGTDFGPSVARGWRGAAIRGLAGAFWRAGLGHPSLGGLERAGGRF